MNLLEVKNAGFAYDQRTIFEDICLNVGQGEMLCIVGPNGCGKTTLLDCILGINKLKCGSISIAGKNINTLKINEVAKSAAL